MNIANRGIIRRIDELGRIVIPKEIRKTLFIHESDQIEICLSGNTICLQKHQPLQPLVRTSEKCLRSFYKNCPVPALICDTDRVIYAIGLSLPNKPGLTEEAKYYIQHAKSYKYNPQTPLIPLENSTEVAEALYFIGTPLEPAGAVLILRKEPPATPIDSFCAHFLADLLTIMISES